MLIRLMWRIPFLNGHSRILKWRCTIFPNFMGMFPDISLIFRPKKNGRYLQSIDSCCMAIELSPAENRNIWWQNPIIFPLSDFSFTIFLAFSTMIFPAMSRRFLRGFPILRHPTPFFVKYRHRDTSTRNSVIGMINPLCLNKSGFSPPLISGGSPYGSKIRGMIQ